MTPTWHIVHRGLAYALARKVHGRMISAGCTSAFEDLMQEALMVLVKIESHYDSTKGAPSTFAYRALMNRLNLLADGEIQRLQFEQEERWLDNGESQFSMIPDSTCIETEISTASAVEAFGAGLSPDAQLLLQNWIAPDTARQIALKARKTRASRCALKTVVEVMGEDGHNVKLLSRARREILVKVQALA